MSWTIELLGRVAVVMTTNAVNAQNRAFFADLHEASTGSNVITRSVPSY